MSKLQQQLFYPAHLFTDDDASAVWWLAVLIAIAMHLMLWFISIDLPQPKPQQPGLDVSFIELPSSTETAPGEQIDSISSIEQIPEPQQSAAPEQPEPERVLTAEQSTTSIAADLASAPEQPSGSDLFRQGLASAKNFIPQATLAPGELRKKYISASTTDWLYSSYMNAWTQKVERVGNMNYPEAALRRNLRGDLVMSVGIRADGSLESIEVLRESGYAALDEAAIRIVELSAPYSVLPEQIANEVDVLYITRTWRFSPDDKSFN